VPLTTESPALPRAAGVYRIRGGERRIVYIGEGTIRSRLAQHRMSAAAAASAQGHALAAAQPLACSWVANAAWEHHQRLELENDLIAAWVLGASRPDSERDKPMGGPSPGPSGPSSAPAQLK
jgi:hypothetical protein